MMIPRTGILILLILVLMGCHSISVHGVMCFQNDSASKGGSHYYIWDDFDDGVINTSIWYPRGSLVEANGNITMGFERTWQDSLGTNIAGIPGGTLPLSNITIEFRVKVEGQTQNYNIISFQGTACAGSKNASGCTFAMDSGVFKKGFVGSGYTDDAIEDEWNQTNAVTPYASIWVQDGLKVSVWHNYSLYIYNETRVLLYDENGTYQGTKNFKEGLTEGHFKGFFGASVPFETTKLSFDYIIVYNGTACPVDAPVGDTLPPETDLINPGNASLNSTLNQYFTFNATTNDDFSNCTLWTNDTSWGIKDQNTSLITSGVEYTFNHTFTGSGDYLWSIACCDLTGNCAFNDTNRTISIDIDPPLFSDGSDPISADIGETFRFSILIHDDHPGIYVISHNNTGAFVNQSYLYSDEREYSNFNETYKELTSLDLMHDGNWSTLGGTHELVPPFISYDYETYSINNTANVSGITIRAKGEGAGACYYEFYLYNSSSGSYALYVNETDSVNTYDIPLYDLSALNGSNLIMRHGGKYINGVCGVNLYETNITVNYYNFSSYTNGENVSLNITLDNPGYTCFMAYASDSVGSYNTSDQYCVLVTSTAINSSNVTIGNVTGWTINRSYFTIDEQCMVIVNATPGYNITMEYETERGWFNITLNDTYDGNQSFIFDKNYLGSNPSNCTDIYVLRLHSLNGTNSSHHICYQETANISTGCGDEDTGSYTFSGVWFSTPTGFSTDVLWDGAMSTGTTSTTTGIMIINYTVPLHTYTATWQIGFTAGTPDIINISIPGECLYTDPNRTVSLKIVSSYNSIATSNASAYCLSGGSYILLYNTTPGLLQNAVWEEGIYWYIQDPLLNTTYCLTDLSTIYNYPSESYNSTEDEITFLVNYSREDTGAVIHGNCTVDINSYTYSMYYDPSTSLMRYDLRTALLLPSQYDYGITCKNASYESQSYPDYTYFIIRSGTGNIGDGGSGGGGESTSSIEIRTQSAASPEPIYITETVSFACGDGLCDIEHGETIDACPLDCKPRLFDSSVIRWELLGLLSAIGLLSYYMYTDSKKSRKSSLKSKTVYSKPLQRG